MAASSSHERGQRLLETIQKMLDELPDQSGNCCIYRVPKLLRGLNPEAYTPMAVPIGPLHHKVHEQDSSQVDDLESISNQLYKLQYLKNFLQSTQYQLKDYLEMVRKHITAIRCCYAYSDKIFNDDDYIFTEMVLLDCVFIIQLFREHSQHWKDQPRSILMAPLKLKEIASDLLLAENQLPLFILKELYEYECSFYHQREGQRDESISFNDIACEFFKILSKIDPYNNAPPSHLLDMFRFSLLPPWEFEDNGTFFPGTTLKTTFDNGINLQEMMCPTATGLFEAGIKFEVKKDPFSFLDVSFDVKKGILYIPKLRVDDGTERQFRNLIAFEQSHTNGDERSSELPILTPEQSRDMEDDSGVGRDLRIQMERQSLPMDDDIGWRGILEKRFIRDQLFVRNCTYITDYQFFMDCLINTTTDVQLFTKAGIIENLLGSEKNLSELINSMGIHAYNFRGGYLYQRIANELNIYHKKKWNRYEAILKQVYFSHPWAIIPVCYAVVLLILTIIQVVVGILALPALNKQSNN